MINIFGSTEDMKKKCDFVMSGTNEKKKKVAGGWMGHCPFLVRSRYSRLYRDTAGHRHACPGVTQPAAHYDTMQKRCETANNGPRHDRPTHRSERLAHTLASWPLCVAIKNFIS